MNTTQGAPPALDAFWAELVELAETEQRLLQGVLAALFDDADADAAISHALHYPDWPQPLTLLPRLGAHLIQTVPPLATYLQHAAAAADAAIDAVTHHGWPGNDPAGGPLDPATTASAGDAAWLLLQHADHHNDIRRDLLPVLDRAVASGNADPRHLALLTDRTLAVDGEPTPYGTFVLVRDDQPHWLYLDGTRHHRANTEGAAPQFIDPHGIDLDAIDMRRRRIGLPPLAADLRYAYSPIIPYRQARTTPVNPWIGMGPTGAKSPPSGPLPASGRVDSDIGVYLAGTLRHRQLLRRARSNLPAGITCTSRWLEVDPLTRASCQYDAGPALNRFVARMCLDDIAASDVLLAHTAARRSSGLDVEIGAALASGTRVILHGDPRCSFDMLPNVEIASSLDDAIRAVGAFRRADPER